MNSLLPAFLIKPIRTTVSSLEKEGLRKSKQGNILDFGKNILFPKVTNITGVACFKYLVEVMEIIENNMRFNKQVDIIQSDLRQWETCFLLLVVYHHKVVGQIVEA